MTVARHDKCNKKDRYAITLLKEDGSLIEMNMAENRQKVEVEQTHKLHRSKLKQELRNIVDP